MSLFADHFAKLRSKLRSAIFLARETQEDCRCPTRANIQHMQVKASNHKRSKAIAINVSVRNTTTLQETTA